MELGADVSFSYELLVHRRFSSELEIEFLNLSVIYITSIVGP